MLTMPLLLLFGFIWTVSIISTLETGNTALAKLNYTSVTAEIGSTVKLPCNYEGDQNYTVWFKMDDLQPVFNEIYSQDCGLTIKNISSSNAGFYKFQSVKNNMRRGIYIQNSMVQLTVEGSPGVDMESAWDSDESVSVVVEAGDSVVLPCNISLAKRLWIRLSDSWMFSRELDVTYNRTLNTDNGMEISDVTPEDAGVYRCEVATDPTSGSFVELEVKESAAKPGLVIVAAGETATLPCNLDVIDPYKTAWIYVKTMSILTLNEHRITNDDRFSSIPHQHTGTYSLVLHSAHPRDAGVYMCNTNRDPIEHAPVELRIEDSTVTVLPATTLPPVTVRMGTTAYLPCNLQIMDSASITWIRNGNTLTINNSTFTSDDRIRPLYDSKRLTYILTISYARHEDTGSYICRLTSDSLQESEVELIVNDNKPKPKIQVEVVKRVKVQDTVIITCSFEGTQAPSYVMWYKDQKMIIPEKQEDMDIGTDQDRSSLTIGKSTVEHSGQYTCAPTNSPSVDVTLQVEN